jgi:hypothetical protein
MSRFLTFNRGDRSLDPAPVTRAAADSQEADPLLSFSAEGSGDPDETKKKPASPPRLGTSSAAIMLWFLAAGAVIALAVVAYEFRFSESSAAAAAPDSSQQIGQATFDSAPSGAEVRIGGVLRGTTPLKLWLAAGQHQVDIDSGGATRSLAVSVDARTAVSHFVEFAAAAAPSTGTLDVSSEPPGAQVRIDGTLRGVTPISIEALAPGEHTVTVSSGDAIVRRTVTVAAGATSDVAVSIAGATHAAGWVTWKTPFEMQVLENGVLLGTTAVDRLMLPAGRHQLDLVNDTFGFRARIAVQIQPGQSAPASVSIPNGSLSLNALPWADVWIDGRSVGPTPLGDLSVPVGPHDVVWRHPQLGERRQTVHVTVGEPTRVGVDLTR